MTITHNKFFRGAVIALTLFFALSQNLNAQSGMTDKQIVEYVKKRVESGADQKEIAKELLRKFDQLTGDSLNAAEKASKGETKEKPTKKKKLF